MRRRDSLLPAKTGKKQQDTQFKPGQSGNKAGRPQGSRNKVSIILDGMLQKEAEAILNKAVKLALNGNSIMIRALIDKLIPNRKENPVKIRLPTIATAADLPKITATILKAAGAGKITISEAANFSKIVDSHRSALEIFEIQTRLSNIENKMNEEGKKYDHKQHR